MESKPKVEVDWSMYHFAYSSYCSGGSSNDRGFKAKVFNSSGQIQKNEGFLKKWCEIILFSRKQFGMMEKNLDSKKIERLSENVNKNWFHQFQPGKSKFPEIRRRYWSKDALEG